MDNFIMDHLTTWKKFDLLQLIIFDIMRILLAFSYFSTYSEIWSPPNFPLLNSTIFTSLSFLCTVSPLYFPTIHPHHTSTHTSPPSIERPGNRSCHLRANERPNKKCMKSQKHTHRWRLRQLDWPGPEGRVSENKWI